MLVKFTNVGGDKKSWEANCDGELTEDWMYNQARTALNSSNIQFGDKGEIVVGFRIVGRYEIVQEEASEMSEAKFTPGPWELEETEEGHVIRMGKAIGNPSAFPVHMEIEYNHGCLLDGEEGDVFEEGEIKQAEEALANALLIAAAPEMYEALFRVTEFLNELRNHGINRWSGEQAVLDVLSRAQGGETS